MSWDNLIKRGWDGPNFCILCKMKEEDVNHFFLSCAFARSVWEIVLQNMKISGSWEVVSVEDSLRLWLCD